MLTSQLDYTLLLIRGFLRRFITDYRKAIGTILIGKRKVSEEPNDDREGGLE